MRLSASPLRVVRAVVPAGSAPTFSGASVRDPALERRLAGIYIAVVALLGIPALIGPSLALDRKEIAVVVAVGLALGGLVASGEAQLPRWIVFFGGLSVSGLVAVDALVDRPFWPVLASTLALLVLWFATFQSPRAALLQAAFGIAGFGVAAWLHVGLVSGAGITALVGLTLVSSAALLARLQGGAVGMIARDREAFERRLVEGESRLRDTEARYRQLIEALPLVTYISSLDGHGSRQYVSPQIEELLGYPVLEWTVATWEKALHPDERDRVLAARAYHVETGTPYRDEYRIVRPDGTALWVYDEAVVEADRNGKPVQIRGYLQEITDRRRLEEQLAHRALHDPLTGLPNRTLLLERLQHWASRRTPCSIAVLYLDLDDFKYVNDRLGHAAGDAVLVEVAARVSTCVRPEDTISRIGGDEFAIVLEEIELEDAQIVADRIITAISSQPIAGAGQDIVIGASIGIASSPGTGRLSADLVLNHADMAMYEAKGEGKGQTAVYAVEMSAGAATRQRMRSELGRALDDGEFELHFQPIVSLADRNVVGAEALIRWRHPLHGIVSPAKFIDIAVETGQIVQVGRFVLDEACRAAALLRATTNSSLWVTFNLALRELRERDIVELVQEALARHAVRPDALMVEITEAAFLPDERPTTMRLHALKELGLRMAIDDFGTGYSSLSYLTRIPADTVKLARPFIVALDSEGPEATLAQAVVRLCGDLGFSTIGEGIETVRQHERLLELGCPLGQGYLYAKPMPLETLIRAIESGKLKSEPVVAAEPFAAMSVGADR
jgi:diguanylate cyclase (GGDEF)-like protein/PAS domain S-box-containing protein